MFSEDTKILKFYQYCKSDKAPFVTYADLESSIEKIDRCKNNLEKPFMAKACKQTLSGFSMSTTENNHDVYRGKDCMKKFCETLREHAMKIINFRKKWSY